MSGSEKCETKAGWTRVLASTFLTGDQNVDMNTCHQHNACFYVQELLESTDSLVGYWVHAREGPLPCTKTNWHFLYPDTVWAVQSLKPY